MKSIMLIHANAQLPVVIHEGTSDQVLIICHGFRGSKEGGGRAVALAEEVVKLGLSVVRFDFTPLGPLTQQIDELAAVAAFARREIGSRLVLLGRSMGGSAALTYAAAQPEGISGLCLWAAPSNLEETFRLALQENYQRLLAGKTVHVTDSYGRSSLTPAFIQDFASYDLLQAARSLKGIPVLVLHGTEDETVPFTQAETLYQQLVGRKELVAVPDGDHQLHAFYRETTAAILKWIKSLQSSILEKRPKR